ncbi:hypothetical protein [Campylobacter troglodytis]|uniref:hypothetical protein n=1 Tax=Campylobacter troglodytis TaxID=654363 RepID=UPI00163CBAF6|nr:hypothetical protein [Campylobacter troglodytis]
MLWRLMLLADTLRLGKIYLSIYSALHLKTKILAILGVFCADLCLSKIALFANFLALV